MLLSFINAGAGLYDLLTSKFTDETLTKRKGARKPRIQTQETLTTSKIHDVQTRNCKYNINDKHSASFQDVVVRSLTLHVSKQTTSSSGTFTII